MGDVPVDLNRAADDLERDDREEQGLVLRASEAVELGALGGDPTGSVMRLPRLQVTYGVGKLVESFNPGDLVLNGDSMLVKKQEPLQVVIISAFEYWKEYLDSEMYKANMTPRVFRTEKEVLDIGETTQWVNKPVKKAPTFSKAMDLKLLIRKPKDLICGMFGLEFGGHEYAPAIYTADKTAFKRIGPAVNMAANFTFRNRKVDGIDVGLLGGLFTLRTTIEDAKVHPNLKMDEHNSDEFIQFIRGLFTQFTTAQEAPVAEAAE